MCTKPVQKHNLVSFLDNWVQCGTDRGNRRTQNGTEHEQSTNSEQNKTEHFYEEQKAGTRFGTLNIDISTILT